MTNKRKIEIFSAGCVVCDEVVEKIKGMACPSCDVIVLDMHESSIAARAKNLGIRSIPAVVIDDKLLDCCITQGIDESVLKAAGVGSPLEG